MGQDAFGISEKISAVIRPYLKKLNDWRIHSNRDEKSVCVFMMYHFTCLTIICCDTFFLKDFTNWLRDIVCSSFFVSTWAVVSVFVPKGNVEPLYINIFLHTMYITNRIHFETRWSDKSIQNDTDWSVCLTLKFDYACLTCFLCLAVESYCITFFKG